MKVPYLVNSFVMLLKLSGRVGLTMHSSLEAQVAQAELLGVETYFEILCIGPRDALHVGYILHKLSTANVMVGPQSVVEIPCILKERQSRRMSDDPQHSGVCQRHFAQVGGWSALVGPMWRRSMPIRQAPLEHPQNCV